MNAPLDDSLPPDILDAALTDGDAGVPSLDELRGHFPSREKEVLAVWQAVDAYRREVRRARAAGGPGFAPLPERLPAGTRIGDFVVEDVLGGGAMGVVYRARQLALGGRAVALKVLPSQFTRDKRFVERFRREATLAAGIHHPNLAEVYGIVSDGDVLCFAMRLVEGRTLHAVLAELAQERHTSEERCTSASYVRVCARLGRDLAAALAVVHAHGFVHRDVKPANVMIECGGDHGEAALAGHPVLVDFGLLRPTAESDLTGSQTLIGTPAYASPESRLGRPIDARADVFSLGVLLYDLLARTAPSSRVAATAGLPEVRVLNPTVDPRLAAIVDMATRPDARERYTDGAALRDELDRYLRGETVRALPTRALARARLWARRNPSAAVKVGSVVGLFGLLLAAALVWIGLSTWTWFEAARQGAEREAAGDLRSAAIALRPLHDAQQLVAWIPWLGEGRSRAARYWDGVDNPLVELTELLVADGMDAGSPLEQQRRDEQRYDYIHLLVHRRLFDERHPEHRGLMIRFLLRELAVQQPAWRRRLALATLADLMAIEQQPDEWARTLLPDLVRIAQGRDTGLHRAGDRVAAAGALSGIPGSLTFTELVDLVNADDAELRYIAGHGAMRSSSTLLSAGDPTPLAPLQDVLQRWLCHSFESEFSHPPASQSWVSGCGSFLRVVLLRMCGIRHALRERGLLQPWTELPDPLAVALERLEAWLVPQDAVSLAPRVRDVPRPGPGTGIPEVEQPLRTLSAENLRSESRIDCSDYESYQRHVWESPPDTRAIAFLPPYISWAGPCAGVEFRSLQVSLRGDWILGAEHTGTTVQQDWPGHYLTSFLEFRHAGWSSLRIDSAVPPDARSAVIRLFDTRGTRWTLPKGGTAVVSIRLLGTPFEVLREAPPVIRSASFDVSFFDLAGWDRISLAISLRSANTTYRLHSAFIDWLDANGRPVAPPQR